MENREIEKADEYITGKDGSLIGITWSEDNPKKILKRLIELERRVDQLERLENQKDKC